MTLMMIPPPQQHPGPLPKHFQLIFQGQPAAHSGSLAGSRPCGPRETINSDSRRGEAATVTVEGHFCSTLARNAGGGWRGQVCARARSRAREGGVPLFGMGRREGLLCPVASGLSPVQVVQRWTSVPL